MEVILQTIKIFYLKAEGGIPGSKKAFEDLESRLPSRAGEPKFKGRKFYGTFHKGEYRACVGVLSDDDTRKTGLELCEIPRGKYIQKKVKNWEGREHLIGQAFDEMTHRGRVDDNRPSIEFYRRLKEVILFLPIL